MAPLKTWQLFNYIIILAHLVCAFFFVCFNCYECVPEFFALKRKIRNVKFNSYFLAFFSLYLFLSRIKFNANSRTHIKTYCLFNISKLKPKCKNAHLHRMFVWSVYLLVYAVGLYTQFNFCFILELNIYAIDSFLWSFFFFIENASTFRIKETDSLFSHAVNFFAITFFCVINKYLKKICVV